ASRIVIMLGDGVMATGDQTQDSSLRQWMRDGLSEEAGAAGIRIYWLTLSEAADYQTIQRVTQKTGGKYFRAFTPESARSSVLSIFASNAIPANLKAGANGDIGMSGGSPAAQGIDGGFMRLVRTQGGMIAVGAGGVLVLLIVAFAVRSGRRRSANAQAPMMGRRAEDKRVVLRDMSEFTAMAEYDITERRTYIGRLPREVTEHSCVIVIRDTSVGRDHAAIEYRDNGYWLSDHGTVNGTYVNGKRLQGTCRLMAGDKIRFARFEFKIHIPAALAATYERRELDRREPGDTVTEHDDDRTVFRSHRH
ncbi:MAG: FHA domain-containing protein, partial [Candidatus Thiodiazotropha sp.]